MMSFPEFKQWTFDSVIRDFEVQNNIYRPMVWMFSNTQGNVVAMPLDTPCNSAKEQMEWRFRMMMAAKKFSAEMLSFVCEAWTSSSEITGPGKQYARPESDPNRGEMLMIHFEVNNIVYMEESYSILVKKEEGKKSLIDPWNPVRSRVKRGWMTQILR